MNWKRAMPIAAIILAVGLTTAFVRSKRRFVTVDEFRRIDLGMSLEEVQAVIEDPHTIFYEGKLT